MDGKKGTGVDLLTAKEEAKKKIRNLTDEELDKVTGGYSGYYGGGKCPKCGTLNTGIDFTGNNYCKGCGAMLVLEAGDGRDLNEELADVAGLTADVDGFAE